MAEIQNLNEPWENHEGTEVEAFIKEQFTAQETQIAGRVAGVRVNNQELPKDASGKVDITLPVVDPSLSTESNNAVQNAAVTTEINSIKRNTVADMRTEPVEGDTTQLNLVLTNEQGTDFASVRIPAASEIGTVTFARITTELLSQSRIKLGDPISVRWTYDHIIQEEGTQTSSGTAAQNVTIRVLIGTTEVYSETKPNVAAGHSETLTLGPEFITQAGTVNIYVVAQTIYGEEPQRAQGFKSVSVVTMDLATTFDPASALALSNGFTNGQTITIPYAYTVPVGSTIRIYKDGELYDTATISGTARGNVYLAASDLSAGRHNIQMVAESAGLLSNAVSVDLLKAGGTADYLGMRFNNDISVIGDMPQPYAYGSSALTLPAEQFGSLSLDFAVWQSGSMTSTVIVAVDGVTTQSLTADRSMQTLVQRFDESGNHVLTITVGTATRTFGIVVTPAAGVTESEAIGYRKKLTANGRTNNESEATRSDWGGITALAGVDWRTNGWNTDSDGVTALLLTNGATASIDIKPFVLDAGDNDYSIQSRGMTFEMDLKFSQVMQRGATLVSCLFDNDGNGYPMGFKVTTEEAGLYFGGVEEITTAEDLVDENGNYIDYEGNIVPSSQAVKLKVTRPHGVAMNIAPDKWLHLSFVVQPVSGGYGLAMLYINGVLSRANRYSAALRQNTPQAITIDSDKADVRIRGLRYYRTPLTSDEVLANWIIDRPTAALIQAAHANNAVGDSNNTADADGNIAVSRDALVSRGRGVLTIIRSGDSGMGLTDLFTCVDKKANFRADLVRWDPPLDGNGNTVGQGFEARNVRVRIQGTSSVKYPYKNIRIYLTTEQDGVRSLVVGGVDVTDTAGGYALRGPGNSIEQGVICMKTDFVDSSLVLNTGGAHLFNTIMKALHLETPPQEYDARVRQSIDGIPCDIFAGKSEQGVLTYCGQFVLNNEKSKSGKIFGMEGVKDGSGTSITWDVPIALEALNNSSPMTLFQPAGTNGSAALDSQLAAEFDDGFEFNFPEDAKWANVDEGQWDAGKNKWSVKPVPGARAAIKRLMGWIYDCVPSAMRTNPDYGTQQGWSNTSKAKWVSSKFKNEASQYFNVSHLLTYYLFTDYWASVDQRAKNILWRTWDGLKWFATYYDGDTAQSIRNDAFMVYLYNVTRDTYDTERAKYAFEGHSSWLWCLVLANFEDELKQCATNLRAQLTTQTMLNEFNGVMMGNWSERQYNKSGKLKYIDTINTMNYVYTLTGNREAHRTAFLTDRARLLDARYGAGEYNGDVITFTVVRNSGDTPSSLTIKSGDLYYFGYKLNGIWLQGPSRADNNELLTLTFTAQLATNDPLMLGGASCIKELDLTNMGIQLNGTVNLSLCTMLEKLVMPATNGVSNAPLILGDISKLQYIDITGQTAVNTGTNGVFDVSKHTRLTTLLAGGTNLSSVILAEGAPTATLVLPSTLTTLTLRYLSSLTHEGLTLQNPASVTALNFAECPNIDWRVLLTQCVNIRHVRIEGMKGLVRSSVLRPFMTGYDAASANPTANMTYHGLTAGGAEQTYPALIGSVRLIDVVDDFAVMQEFFERCGLELMESQYSEYWFDDLEANPANITNEDNLTGYAYLDETIQDMDDQPNKYAASGHVRLIHDLCWPVSGKISERTGKMTVTRLSKTSFSRTANGDTFSPTDPDGQGYDVFLLVPHYWYKGVNDYKNCRKHFFVSALSHEPASTATITQRHALSTVLFASGKAVDNRLIEAGETFNEDYLATATSYNTYRIPVTGMRQARFPSVNHANFSCAFVAADGTIIAMHTLNMDNSNSLNPADFMNAEGDYDFRSVPDGAAWLYFTCQSAVDQTLEAIAVDSDEVEAIEPDWVEHLPELIGIYQGFVPGMTTGGTVTSGSIGLRSLSGKVVSRGSGTSTTNTSWTYDEEGNPTNIPTTKLNGTAQDFYNLARIRGEGYTTVPYETSKDMANLFMAWFGTRDVESKVGSGGNAGYTTGTRNSVAFGDTNRATMGAASSSNSNQLNKMWGLEGWTASCYEWTDKGCLNAASFRAFIRNRRIANSAWSIDYYCRILKQDGTERKVKARASNTGYNVARVRFGRYCDIIVGSYSGTDTTFATYYAAAQTAYNERGRVLGRSYGNANAYAGVACSIAYHASSGSYTNIGARLCFFGEIVDESE